MKRIRDNDTSLSVCLVSLTDFGIVLLKTEPTMLANSHRNTELYQLMTTKFGEV